MPTHQMSSHLYRQTGVTTNSFILCRNNAVEIVYPNSSMQLVTMPRQLLDDCLHRDKTGVLFANVCQSCASDLRRDKKPVLSLANEMWVGDVPLELQVLTLPERILIGRFFPAVYIIKLYPKKKGARSWATNGLQSGLRGVTFVGPKNLPQKTLPGFLRVNRTRVRDALFWLKRNNPIYEDIIISSDRLNELPTDGIPHEISSLAKHSNDTSLLAEETDGYVPEPCADEDEITAGLGGVTDIENAFIEEDDTGESSVDMEDAQNIPLHSLGVVDVAASEVNENEMLAHALLNVARSEKAEGWAIKHGSDFVNEYPRKTADGELSDGWGNNPNHLLGSFPRLFPYGKGGFEVNRPSPVTYSTHARWAIRYADKRFRKDLYFIFQVFGVLQKRQVCRATALQITRSSFLQHEREIRQLTSFDFETAAAEEQAHKPFSNPVMRNLRQNLSTVRAKTMATDESRINIRSLIWGIPCCPGTLWRKHRSRCFRRSR
ncbi:hypothetical protein EDB85DRAFT_556454 [Lactarius pseudohatsudake]|nr:hypothetical protein EDB85DRAFT_556454 [Lactarius pseudohatsudake]